MRRKPSATWNIVLAAGEGRRLLPLTRALYGTDLPKQFAAFDGGPTLLQRTIERISSLAPPERTVVVAAESHADLAGRQLEPYPAVELIVQPTNLGTGPGAMLPLARVLARDPEAEVLIFPADHHVARPGQFLEACRNARATAAAADSGVALVGVPAERPDTDLGWIVPGDALARAAPGARSVLHFVEKPDEAAALNLLACGGLWNTLIVGGSADALWRLLERHLPRQAKIMAPLRIFRTEPPTAWLLRLLYRSLDPADSSRDVLQRAAGLGVVCMVDSGWSDWGTPERLLAAVEPGTRDSEVFNRLRALWTDVKPATSATEFPRGTA